MNKTIGALALSFLFPAGAFAQSCGTTDLIADLDAGDRARLDALVAEHPYPEGILWRATKPGSEVTVVGTIHMPDPRLEPIVNQVAPIISDADLLILEVTAEDMASMEMMAAEQPDLFFLNDGPTLIDLLSEEDWETVKQRTEALGIPSFMVAKFKPWYLGLTLSIAPCAMASIQSGEEGLDGQLEAVAEVVGVPVAGLDDTAALLQLLGGDPLEEQLDDLRLGLSINFDSAPMTATLTEGYFDGRIREVWEFTRIVIDDLEIEGGQEMFDELDRDLLVGRNRDWEPQIAEMVEGKDVVIAVGAAHLSGESGVLRALERAGYELQPF